MGRIWAKALLALETVRRYMYYFYFCFKFYIFSRLPFFYFKFLKIDAFIIQKNEGEINTIVCSLCKIHVKSQSIL